MAAPTSHKRLRGSDYEAFNELLLQIMEEHPEDAIVQQTIKCMLGLIDEDQIDPLLTALENELGSSLTFQATPALQDVLAAKTAEKTNNLSLEEGLQRSTNDSTTSEKRISKRSRESEFA